MLLKKATQYGRWTNTGANTSRLQLHFSSALVFEYNPYPIDLYVHFIIFFMEILWKIYK